MERYEAYKDSGVDWIGEIPESWKNIATKRLVSIANGSDPMTEGDIPVYGSSGVAFKTCGESKDPPAVLLGRKGTIDSPSYIEIPYWNVDTAFDAKPLSGGLLLKYYFYLANCFDYGKYQTATALPSMTQTNYGDMRIPVPSTAEQQAIVDYLDAKTAEIDGLVADCEREVELLREYRKAVISEVVTKGLDPDAPMKDSGIEWIGEIPEGWRVKRLKFLLRASLQYGATESGIPFDESLPRYIRITDIDSLGKLKEDDKKSLSPDLAAPYMLADEDILFARSGATVGKAFLYRADMGDAAFAGYLIKAACKREVLLPSYLSYWTQSVLYDFWKESVFNQATIQNIGADKYKELPIVVPDTRIQFEIKSYLEAKTAEIDSLIEAKQSMADKLREYRKSLISEAVTGKFKVPGI